MCINQSEYWIGLKRNVTKMIKEWRNWPAFLARHYRFRLESGVTFFSIANDSQINNSICQAILASFAKA